MPFVIRFAFRYLLSKRGGLTRLTTIIAVLGIAFGVACLIVVQAIYEGFQNGVQNRLLSQTAHISVSYDRSQGASSELVAATIRKNPNVEQVRPVMYLSSVISKDGRSAYGLLTVHFSSEEGAAGKIFFGKGLARQIAANIDEEVEILFQIEDQETVNTKVRLAGLIETGLYEYDSQLISIHFEDYLRLSQAKRAEPNSFVVTLADPFKAQATVVNLTRELGPGYDIQDWRSANRPLFDALKFPETICSVPYFVSTLVEVS